MLSDEEILNGVSEDRLSSCIRRSPKGNFDLRGSANHPPSSPATRIQLSDIVLGSATASCSPRQTRQFPNIEVEQHTTTSAAGIGFAADEERGNPTMHGPAGSSVEAPTHASLETGGCEDAS